MIVCLFQVLACLELLESLPLQQAERYAHELVTWLSGILEKDQSDGQVRLTRFMFCHFCSLKVSSLLMGHHHHQVYSPQENKNKY